MINKTLLKFSLESCNHFQSSRKNEWLPPLEVNHFNLGMTYNYMNLAIIEKLFPSQVPTLLLIILKRLSFV